MNHRELAFVLILFITFGQRLQLSAAQKCKPLSGSNNFGIYRCQGVQTLSEIEQELMPTWRGIVVSNRKEDYLDFTPQSGEQQTETKWAQITDLDLSQAGALNLEDGSFSSFTALERLNLTNAQLDGLKTRYFPVASKLELLDVSGNDLQSLRAVNFQHLTQLRVANFHIII
uniref:Chaoptin n=1 Tax=Bactrocera dorsalis TaxID=27457 RepID=A0A034WUI4_BACDO